MVKIASIDIGSTWTKGAIFDFNGSVLEFKARAVHKTTVENLSEGFFNVLSSLAPSYNNSLKDNGLELFYSSSAKGGLAVAVIGIVPDITLATAKVAAFSAGAKISSYFSYHMTDADVFALEQSMPDIVLFTGGTDGGNKEYVLSNAEQLSRSSLNCSIIYAGNRDLVDDVQSILSNKDLVIVENLLPEIDVQNFQPARDAMRDIFLSKIVQGKGLQEIVDAVSQEPWPTPFAMHELSQYICQFVPDWKEFMLLDLGGATTDVYSSHLEKIAPGTVIRGLLEPEVKRTVEGDLGLRISAPTVIESNKTMLCHELSQSQQSLAEIEAYTGSLKESPEHISTEKNDSIMDALIAGSCIASACARHVGRMHVVHTADGAVNVQLGRDLRKVEKMVGSGGFLANHEAFNPNDWLKKMPEDNRGRHILLPENVDYYQDRQYLLPLFANIAQKYPEAAATSAINSLSFSSINSRQQDAVAHASF